MPDRQQTAPGVVLFDGTTGQNFGNSNLSAAGRDHINLSINLATGGAGHQYSSQTPESATSSPPLIVQGSERPAQDPSLFTRVYRSFCHRSRRRPRSNGQDLHEPENVPQYPRIEVTQHDRPVPGLSSPSPSPVVTLLSDGGSITSFDNYSQSVRIGISNEEEVFERCLLPKGHGYPMFNPRPLRGPVKFGDYGILGPDGFDSFGNLYNPENQQELSISHIPEPFITSQPEKLHEGQIISTGIEDARQFRTVNQNNVTDMFEFHCRQTQGAVLAVTSSGELETLTPKSRNQLRKYLCKHGSHLMATLRREDYLEPGQSLYVVTGTIKSSSWAIAVHTSLMQKPFDQVVLTRREDKSGASFPTYTWTSQGSAAARSVASVALDEEGGRIKDQCLFLRGFLLTPSLDSDLVQRRNPSSGSNSSAGDSGSSPGSTDSHNSSRDGGPANSRQQKRFPEPNHRNASLDGSFPHQLRDIFQPFGLVPPFPVPTSNSKHYYPSRRINDVLLEDESVNLAITHDDDWQVSLKILDGYLDDEAVSALMTAVWENNISTVSNGRCCHDRPCRG
ncbi:hypothetical protein BKA70DRAFT_483173 [Coprinopsis sp. MPI-PUGE-AT-0042]|nr:hypothetical protein BKA70DRAFT_483173 [Coprinopsis sp. MPI-PUGE-AT-0042]